MDGVVRERYPDEENRVLSRDMGVSVRSLERHAAMLGVRKSAAYLSWVQRQGVAGAIDACDARRRRGEKRRLSRCGGRAFEKGHRFSGEVERRRVEGIRRGKSFAKLIKSCNFGAMELRDLSDKELGDLFEARKRALITVRDEIDRREKWRKRGANVEWTDYVGDGIEDDKY